MSDTENYFKFRVGDIVQAYGHTPLMEVMRTEQCARTTDNPEGSAYVVRCYKNTEYDKAYKTFPQCNLRFVAIHLEDSYWQRTEDFPAALTESERQFIHTHCTCYKRQYNVFLPDFNKGIWVDTVEELTLYSRKDIRECINRRDVKVIL